jgi:TrmH family RNA methyltransferase
VPTVTSRQNAVVARFRSAARRETPDAMLLDGTHLVAEALDTGIVLREAAILADGRDRPDVAAITARLHQSAVATTSVSATVIGAISPVRSASPVVAIAACPTMNRLEIFRGASLVVVAIDIQDPGNLGAIARVAEAAGATGIVCAGASADPFGWKALRGSMGSLLRLPVVVTSDPLEAIRQARDGGCRIVATVPRDGDPLFEADLGGAVAVLIGGEGRGLTPAQLAAADLRVVIPMQAPVESLNASVAAALVLYEARRQRTATS